MLNAPQKKAVETTKGRVLVLAGAGSGKTRVIIHRIAHLIQNCNVPPTAILGLTFTNKAAQEMRQRLGKMISPSVAKQVTLCTFHSFCMKLLRKEISRLGYTNNFSLYDEKDVQRLFSQVAKDTLKVKETPPIAPLLESIASYRNTAKGNDQIEDESIKEMASELDRCMRTYNAVDFDSLITLTIRLFEEHPEVLEACHKRFQYIMIDEFQDTNPAQSRLAELICKKSQNLCVVGDDDQAIYSWRGAEVSHILNFDANTTIKLEQNYRSTKSILQAATHVIQNNKTRHDKTLWSDKASGEPISVFCAPTDVDESQAVAEKILAIKQERNLNWKDIAILYRSNILSRNLELALMKAPWKKGDDWVRGIPYEVFGGMEFSQRSEIKDLFAYLRTIANPKDSEAILRILNVPRRGISNQTIDVLTQIERKNKVPLWDVLEDAIKNPIENLSAKANQGIKDFLELIETAQSHFAKLPLGETLKWFLQIVDFPRIIQEETKSDKVRRFKWENVLECINAIAQYEQDTPDASLHDFVSSTLLSNQKMRGKKANNKGDCVQLMTFHSAKGLEFPICFIIGLEDHILPHEKSILTTGIEEERRLFYVAITRAQQHLTLSMAKSRMKMGKPTKSNPSRFLFEIPKELLEPIPWKNSL